MDLADQQARLQPALLGLLRRVAAAGDVKELAFIAVNEAHGLAAYRQAALWLDDGGVVALSGVVAPEANAPYTHFLQHVFQSLSLSAMSSQPEVLRSDALNPAVAQEWGDWLPLQALVIPLPVTGQWRGGLLMLVREEPWTPIELAPMGDFGRQLALGFAAQQKPSWLSPRGKVEVDTSVPRWRRLLASRRALTVAAFLGVMLLPVRLSVLAPAELVAANPEVVRSPLDGVVERVLVEPNQRVQAGDPLFEFDSAAIQSQLQVAERALDTLGAEYRQRAQQALVDEPSRAALAVISGRTEEQRAEVEYLRALAERGLVLATDDGVVIFDDPAEWVGRPVVTGEKVMLVAREYEAELEAWLAPDDLIPLAEQASLLLYLNADPLTAIKAELRYVAYQASERPDGSFAYRARASLAADEEPRRIGLKGTAKLSGERVGVWYWLLRKPLAALRGWLGV